MDMSIFTLLTDIDMTLPFYVTNAGGWSHQEPVVRENGFPHFQWIQCVNGQGALTVHGTSQTVSRGQGMLLYPQTPHHYYPVTEPWEVRWVAFNGSHAKEMLANMGFTRSQVLYVSNPDLTLKKIHEAATILQSSDPMRSFECSAVVYQLILDLCKYASGAEIRSKQQHFDQLSPVLSYIETNYRQPLTLKHLAGQIAVSPQYCCRLFQQTLGMRPFEYVTRLRLRKAKELLLQELDMEIKEIADRVGYEHPSYFIKIFKQQEGVTPNVFRKIHRLS